jgi:hypothetical protein
MTQNVENVKHPGDDDPWRHKEYTLCPVYKARAFCPSLQCSMSRPPQENPNKKVINDIEYCLCDNNPMQYVSNAERKSKQRVLTILNIVCECR